VVIGKKSDDIPSFDIRLMIYLLTECTNVSVTDRSSSR